jgi:hypothetical protein
VELSEPTIRVVRSHERSTDTVAEAPAVDYTTAE